MASMLRRLVVVLSVFAFLGGIAVQTPGALGAINDPTVMGHDEMGCAGIIHPPAQAGDMNRQAQIGALLGERQIRKLGDAWMHAGGNVVVVILLFTGWKGGELVYRHRVGVADPPN